MPAPVLITRKSLAAGAADAWARQYEGNKEKRFITVGGRLRGLGKNPDPDRVDSIIGNTSWTSVMCSACGAFVGEAIRVGQEPDYESATATLCLSCFDQAAALREAFRFGDPL